MQVTGDIIQMLQSSILFQNMSIFLSVARNLGNPIMGILILVRPGFSVMPVESGGHYLREAY